MTDHIITATVNSRVEKLSELWINLASQRLGSKVLRASDEFFAPKERLIDSNTPIFVPDKYDEHGKWMDGWESRRRRSPGHDWCIIKLGYPGRVKFIDIDTSFFTGNYAPKASIDACYSSHENP
ncbi:MAG: allantoicase, partial [Desulfobulbia bacterium]